MSDNQKLSETKDHPLTSDDPNKKEWVKFEEEEVKPTSSNNSNNEPAVLPTSSIHIQIENSSKSSNGIDNITSISENKAGSPAVINITTTDKVEPEMKTVVLNPDRVIQEGFSNGDIIVTLLPTNESLPWITPAIFRPELVPEELMAQGLSLTVEEYVNAMETLVNDYRFTMYNVLYKRVLMIWITLAFCVLLGLLFSGVTGILLFSLGVSWLFLNAVAIFFCMWIKLRLSRGLEKCLARVNKLLLRHKIMIALDDRGNISCHKIHLCFIYFNPQQCINYLNTFLERTQTENGQPIPEGWESRLDIDDNDIVIQGKSNTRVSRKQDRGEQLILRYGSRWGHEMNRSYLRVTSDTPARHIAKHLCPCQYIEGHLKCKPQGNYCLCYPSYSNDNHLYMY